MIRRWMGWMGAMVLLALLPALAEGQIVDTLAGFADDATGWSGGLGASIATTGGNTERLDLSTTARTQWLGDGDRWRCIGGYTRASSEGATIAESAFAHLRQNHRLSHRWWTLAFAQVSHEPFQRLRSRVLLGAGAQVSLLRDEKRRLAIGAAPMFEWERLEDVTGTDFDQRLSTFLDVEAELRAGVTLAATAFAQPRWQDLGDLRAILNARLAVALADHLQLVVGASMTHDSDPPTAVESTDWSLRTGLQIDL